jgi:hypothetical protein
MIRNRPAFPQTGVLDGTHRFEQMQRQSVDVHLAAVVDKISGIHRSPNLGPSEVFVASTTRQSHPMQADQVKENRP